MDPRKLQYNIVQRADPVLGYKHTQKSVEKLINFILSD